MEEQEKIARHFYAKLQERFENLSADIHITISGAGVNWNCKVTYQDRYCGIYCTTDISQNREKPLYQISFVEDTERVAQGQISDISVALQSIQCWIDQALVEEMYESFEFVDFDKRNLERIAARVLNLYPELGQEADSKLTQDEFSTWHYAIKKDNRCCELIGFGVNEPISFNFKVEDTLLFESDRNFEDLITMVKHWLIDEWPPSKLEANFLDLDTGKLAKYYEEGRLIEGELVVSWDNIEHFFTDTNFEYFPAKYKILDLIRSMRAKGYDHHLRAGQSLYFLVLSRSRRHGLQTDQSFMQFDYPDEMLRVNIVINGESNTLLTKIAYTPELELLLEKLKDCPID